MVSRGENGIDYVLPRLVCSRLAFNRLYIQVDHVDHLVHSHYAVDDQAAAITSTGFIVS